MLCFKVNEDGTLRKPTKGATYIQSRKDLPKIMHNLPQKIRNFVYCRSQQNNTHESIHDKHSPVNTDEPSDVKEEDDNTIETIYDNQSIVYIDESSDAEEEDDNKIEESIHDNHSPAVSIDEKNEQDLLSLPQPTEINLEEEYENDTHTKMGLLLVLFVALLSVAAIQMHLCSSQSLTIDTSAVKYNMLATVLFSVLPGRWYETFLEQDHNEYDHSYIVNK